MKEQHYFEVYGGSVFGPFKSELAAKRGYCKHVRESGNRQPARFFMRSGGRRVDLTDMAREQGTTLPRSIYTHASRGERGTGELAAKNRMAQRARRDTTLQTLYGSFRCDGCGEIIGYLYDYDGTIGCPECGTEPSAKDMALALDVPAHGQKTSLPVVALNRRNEETR